MIRVRVVNRERIVFMVIECFPLEHNLPRKVTGMVFIKLICRRSVGLQERVRTGNPMP
jgi:hypothetical protein